MHVTQDEINLFNDPMLSVDKQVRT